MIRRIKPWLLCLAALTVLVGCQEDATLPDNDPGEMSGNITVGGDDFTIVIDEAGSTENPIKGPFTLRGRNLRYDDSIGALLVDLVVINSGRVSHPEPIGLTFVQLLPDSVTVLNPDNDLHGPGAAIIFEFANDDAMWTPGEESFPRTVRFGVDPLTAVGFVARMDIGGGSFGGMISGRVWSDGDGDGVMDEGEPGLYGIKVWLGGNAIRYWNCGKCIPETTTDENGFYSFDMLPAGAFEVQVQYIFPDAWLIPTTPTTMHVLLPEIHGGVAHFDQANFGFGTHAPHQIRIPIEMDTVVREDTAGRRNDNYGCDPYLVVAGWDAAQTLLYVDVAAFFSRWAGPLPPRAEDAFIELNLAEYRDGTSQTYQLNLHRVIDSGDRTPWIEGNGSSDMVPVGNGEDDPFPCADPDAAFGVAWVGAGQGGDENNQTRPSYDPQILSTIYLNQDTIEVGRELQWNITDLVNGWISGEIENFGLVLRDSTYDETQFKSIAFHSKDTYLEALGIQPELVITLDTRTEDD